MPTYQYACTECGNAFEAVQSFSDDALTECPACNGRLRKVFSSVGIVFKGSGFYRNDSREAAKISTASDKNGTDTSDKGDKPSEKKETAGAKAADSGTKTSDSPAKNPTTSNASTPSKPSPAGSKSSSTAGSAA